MQRVQKKSKRRKYTEGVHEEHGGREVEDRVMMQEKC